MQEQKDLAKINMRILRKYAELAGIFLGPDNGIRVTTMLAVGQQEKEEWKPHAEMVRKEKEKEGILNPTEEEAEAEEHEEEVERLKQRNMMRR